MAVLRDALMKNPRLKLILMSATLDTELFLSYFDKSYHIQVPGRMFPVDEFYLEDILVQVNYKMSNKVFQSYFNEIFYMHSLLIKNGVKGPVGLAARFHGNGGFWP